MFGYIVVNKPELKIKDFDLYQSYYCGLCQSLKHNHGRKSQLTLSNDLTFIGVLLSSLYEPKDIEKTIRCPLHPLHKKHVRYNQYFDYASDMTIVLTYYKFEDDVLDEKSMKSQTLRLLFQREFNKVFKKYPDKVKRIKEELDRIHDLENHECDDLDEISGCFGRIMGDICVYEDDIFKDDLYQMGFYLGKFIYLMDAYDDVLDDIKHNHYNPFKSRVKHSSFDDECYRILEMMISQSSFYFEKLPIIQNLEILKNIIYSGVWTKFEIVKKKRMEEQS